MVLYSKNDVFATLNEDCVNVNILTFYVYEKFHHYFLPKIFDRSVLSYIFYRFGGYDSYDLISDLFDEIDFGTAHEYTKECYQDFCVAMEHFRNFYESEG